VSTKEYHKQHNFKRYQTPEYKAYMREYALKQYGISLEIYESILIEQNYCCAICGKHQSNFKKRLAVDHNHETGEIRGLLCTGCNKFIISDRTANFFEKIVNYMKNSKHKGTGETVGRGRK
jgi:hypothetical protein